MLPVACVSSDICGDFFVLILCLLTLVVRAKSWTEHFHVALLATVLSAKVVLRARARAAYLRHRVAIVIVTRIIMMLCAFTTNMECFSSTTCFRYGVQAGGRAGGWWVAEGVEVLIRG